jgi:dipeptidyl aminopeptidase/acylaminoacyl peptidase
VIRSIPDFDADRYVTSLVLVDVATGRLHAVTDGKQGVSSPHWAPQGDRLAYITSGKDGSDQVLMMPVVGGSAAQVTHARHGVQQFAWSPDGKWVAYVTPDDNPREADVRKHDDLFEVHDDGYLTSSRPVPSHLWIVPSHGGPARRLTHGSWSIAEVGAPFSGGPSDPSWSPDGRWITFARQATPDDSDSDRCTIAGVNVATGAVRSVTGGTGYEYQPVFSPKDGTIAFIRPHGPTPLSIMDLCRTGIIGRDADMAAGFDHNVLAFWWLPGGSGLVLQANERIQTGLWLFEDNKTTRLDLGGLSAADVGIGPHQSLAVVASGPSSPQELYWISGSSQRPRRLTNLNAALGRFVYGRVEEFRWAAPDGEPCDGVLTYPLGYVPSHRYPLAVVIHGGPEAASTGNFESNPLRQDLAARGYVVLQPNYRGSDNLGAAHEHAIYLDPGEGPGRDVIAGIDALEAAGLVDSSRVSVAGHSYGGFMTSWLIGHDHRWRSAVVSDGLADWTALYNLSADGNLAMARDSLGGTPSDPAAAPLYVSGSPITYAGNITTPTLILHGTADETVPISSSYALYHTLKDHHVPVRFIAVPGAHHSPSDPVRHRRFFQLMIEWIIGHDSASSRD